MAHGDTDLISEGKLQQRTKHIAKRLTDCL